MNESYKIASTKHSAIFRRAFKSYLDLYLICLLIGYKNLDKSVTPESFEKFSYNHPGIPEALKAYQKSKSSDDLNGIRIKELDDAISKWLNEKTNLIPKFKTTFRKNHLIDIQSFKQFYKHDEYDRQCHYCQITESEIADLIDKGKIFTKRLSTRGRTMEVDQKDPTKGYIEGNIALCCYWCNNAKTDEFKENEFLIIGKVINHIWNDRKLNKNI